MKYGHPDSTWSEHDRITWQEAQRESARNRSFVNRYEANRRAQFDAGMHPHAIDESNPFAGTVMRFCDPGCVLHRSVA